MPFLVNSIETKSKKFDFSWSEQGEFVCNALWVNGLELLNAIELLDFEGGSFQTHLCSCCGVEGCESGSWAALRSFGDYILLVPAIERMSEGSWERTEYSPPYFLRKYGVPAFTKQQYEGLVLTYAKLPQVNLIRDLSNAELLTVLQMEAPGRILGEIAEPVKLNPEPIIAVEEGQLDLEISKFEKLVENLNLREAAIWPTRIDSEVKFILDLPGFPDWMPMAYTDSMPCVYVGIKSTSNK